MNVEVTKMRHDGGSRAFYARRFAALLVLFISSILGTSISAFAATSITLHRTGVDDAPTPSIWVYPDYNFLISNAEFTQNGSDFSKNSVTNRIVTSKKSTTGSFTLTWKNAASGGDYTGYRDISVSLTCSNVQRVGDAGSTVLSDNSTLNALVFGANDGSTGSYTTADFTLTFKSPSGTVLSTGQYLLSFRDIDQTNSTADGTESVELLSGMQGDVYLASDSTLAVSNNNTKFIGTKDDNNTYKSGFIATVDPESSFRMTSPGWAYTQLFDNSGSYNIVISADSHTTASPTKLYVTRKQRATATVISSPGYKLSGATCDGKSVFNELTTRNNYYYYTIDNVLSNHTLYFSSSPISYYIDFDGNGASSGSMSSITATYDTSCALPRNQFTKYGSEFQGWVVKGTTHPIYEDMTTVENLTQNENEHVTLVAQWKSNTHHVKYKDGHDESIIYEEDVQDGGNGSFNKEAVPSHQGYTFTGFDKPTTNITADETITALYRPNRYTIRFDKNAAGATGNMDDMSMEYDSFKRLTKNQFTYAGHKFVGWCENADGVGIGILNDETTIKNFTTIDNAVVTLYAQWSTNTYQVTFVDGLTKKNISSVSVEYGSNAQMPDIPLHPGYTSTGWDKSASNITSDMTITVNYRANKYTIQFNSNDTNATGTMSSMSMEYGQTKNLTTNAFKAAGHTWLNWNTQANGGGQTYTDKQSVSNLTDVDGATVTLYAQWSTNAYTVTFVDGYNHSTISTVSVKYGGAATAPQAPKHDGYTAAGWDKSFNKVTESITVTMQYTANSYVINFDKNGGNGDVNSLNMTYDKDKALTANTFSKTGYTWTGWNTQANGQGTPYTDKQSVRNLVSENNGSITLYAQYSPNIYKIQFDKNRADATGTTNSMSMTYDETKALTDNGFTSPSAKFTGWNTKSNGSGKSYSNQTEVKNLTAAPNDIVTLYAQWSTNSYTVKFVDGHDSKTISTVNVEYGQNATPPAKPTHKGYTATTWSGTYQNVTKNETVTLNYRPNTYEISFAQNGGTSGSMQNETMSYDAAKKLKKNTFARTGYTFTSWKNQDSSATYTDEQEVNNLTDTDGATVTLVAQWKANRYSVKYDANGGTGNMPDQTIEYDKTVNLSTNAFSRQGYAFAGWKRDDKNSGKDYRNGESVTNLLSDDGASTTMYAQWSINSYTVTFVDGRNGQTITTAAAAYGSSAKEPNKPVHKGYTATGWDKSLDNITSDTTITLNYRPNKYTIHFDGNGDNVEGATADKAMEYDKEDALTANGFTRNGYAWAGWATSANGNGTKYTDKQKVSNVSDTDGATVTLYAQWKINSYTVTFIDGHNGQTIMTAAVTYGSSAKEPSKPVHKGYTATGWDKSLDNITGNVTITLNYRPNKYTIHFDGNGDNVEGTTSDKSMEYDKEDVLPASGFTRKGYTWTGWATSADGSGTKYANKQKVSNVSDTDGATVTLYAQWKINSYTVTFIDGHNGKTITTSSVAYGSSAKAPDKPTHAGYMATDWDKSLDNITGDVTITLNYRPNEYTIAFNGNGTNVDGTTDSKSMKYDSEDTLPANGFTRTGYTWTGWSTAADGNGTTYTDAQKVSNLTDKDGETVTLYAQWKANKYTITFVDGVTGDVISRQEISYGDDIKYPPVPQHPGYKSSGWNASTKDITSDTTFTVSYTPNSYRIVFDKNSDEASGQMSDQPMTYDASAALSTNAFNRPGYRFTGWNTKSNASGTAYTDKEQVKNLTSEDNATITLYAQWIESSHVSITYKMKSDDDKGDDNKISRALEDLNPSTGTAKGSTATPSKAYNFIGWYDENDKLVSKEAAFVPSKPKNTDWTNAVYTAKFERKTLDISFVDGDGNVIKKETIKYGDKATPPDAPQRDGYEFIGWDKDIDSVTDGGPIKPLYRQIKKDDTTNQEPQPTPAQDDGNLNDLAQTGIEILPFATVFAAAIAVAVSVNRRRH